MSAFAPWPSIGKLSDVRAYHPVTYRPKVKLHGTHASVRIDSVSNGGAVTAQFRTRDLSPGDTDNFGFAAWLSEFENALHPWRDDRVLYGEWYGPGVQKGVPLGELGRRKFAVYAARYGDSTLIIEPSQLRILCDALPCHVLPWYGPAFSYDFTSPDAALVERLNAEVEAIDRQCPWAYEMHGLEGVGEGLVMYPLMSSGSMDLAWKAKGASHRTSGKQAVSSRTVASADVVAFVDDVLTEARLDQALLEACGCVRDPRLTSQFLKWLGNDVQKECARELEASGLEWSQVAKTLARRAVHWYTRSCNDAHAE